MNAIHAGNISSVGFSTLFKVPLFLIPNKKADVAIHGKKGSAFRNRNFVLFENFIKAENLPRP